jgi:ubiquinone/menaquinone biosynthesis C-methylase UbiE
VHYFSISKKLIPNSLFIQLFGNRIKFGTKPIQTDTDWIRWEEIAATFYAESQKVGIGSFVNNAGYKNIKKINFHNKTILEIGPGDINHLKYWRLKPKKFTIIDVDKNMAMFAQNRLNEIKVQPTTYVVKRNSLLPIEDNSVDIVISYYSLEHILELEKYLIDISRVLKPGGILVGAIPAEGGVAWGLGRMLTTSKWIKKKHGIDLNKIICWEHPNFASEIIKLLDKHFNKIELKAWPMPFVPLIDLNLIVKFNYAKKFTENQNQ